MQKFLLDSSFLVALFLENDVHHEKVLNFFIAIPQHGVLFFVSQRVIEEVATVLTYKGGKNVSEKFLDFIDNDELFRILDNDHHNELDFYRNQILDNISFIDASLIYQSGLFDLEILTFDKELIKIAYSFKN